VYNVAAILWLQFVVHVMLLPMINVLYLYISTFRSMCAVSNTAFFSTFLVSCFPDMLLRYFLNDFEMVRVSPIITGITFIFTNHTSYISIVSSLYI
jgi:hypothetical protein